MNTPHLAVQQIDTPIGSLHICANETGICLMAFSDSAHLARTVSLLERRARITAGTNAHIRQAALEISEYFAGRRQHFTTALQPYGSDFQQTVWTALQGIPYGTTTHYQALAAYVDRPTATRAVAAANAANPIAILIPCHRVIDKQGGLTGYAGGLFRKNWLLAHERQFSLSSTRSSVCT
ncbi:MAG: methylated-DNA--[protein]-cysteine S-methyltransferase [Cardiobacteriaceae bacterium]|nr:methylated-DNA--[protein]-cysteine S-methyltransferase [Cardiobacteriaceae bacterium]